MNLKLPNSYGRVEKKFFLNWKDYKIISDFCRKTMKADPYSSDKLTYIVKSLYFDTHNMDFFKDKINGEFAHTKVRLRKYDKVERWEVKTKTLERSWKYSTSLREKTSSIMPPSEITDITGFLKPICEVSYEREAYNYESLRVNFDFAIRYNFPKAKSMALPNNKVLMEIKYLNEELPPFLQRILSDLSLEQVSFSKYCDSIENYLSKNFQEVLH